MVQTTGQKAEDRKTTPTVVGSERRAAVRRVSIEQEQADFAAWRREYRRWTQTGCSAPARRGEIEWGGEDNGTNH